MRMRAPELMLSVCYGPGARVLTHIWGRECMENCVLPIPADCVGGRLQYVVKGMLSVDSRCGLSCTYWGQHFTGGWHSSQAS